MTANVPARVNLTKQLISDVAMDIGKEMVAYLEVMYPDIFNAMNGGCKLSIRNHIHNNIMAVLEYSTEEEYRAWISRRKAFRREWLATYRKIRKARP